MKSEFVGRIGNGIDFVGDGNGTGDCNGHGTYVAGTVGGQTVGVASGAELHPVRVFGCSGSTPASTVIVAMNWVAGNRIGPAVANMSLGGPGVSQAENDAVHNLVASGVVVVAAGNDNLDACQYSPASAPDAITVAASDRLDGRDSFSNWGGCVDLFAPGVGIMSASNAGDSLYTTMSGTSMASPHVAGIAAVFLSRYPNATTAEVADAIATQATPNHIADPQTSPNRLAYSILYQPVPPIPPVPPVPFNPAVMGIINSLLLDDADTDTDTDGIPDATDNCPAIANADQIDTDGDREGNACDTDDDNDGAPDAQDAFPLDPTESVDTDGDGTGNRADLDDDNDGAPDAQDAFLLDPTESVDTDGDGIGNNADLDDDNDGVLDATDSCLLTANPDQADVCDPTPNFCLECLPSRGGWRAILQ